VNEQIRFNLAEAISRLANIGTDDRQPPGHQGQPPALMSGAGRAPPRCGEIAGVDLSISWLAVRLTA
jgi:hypothetical protein